MATVKQVAQEFAQADFGSLLRKYGPVGGKTKDLKGGALRMTYDGWLENGQAGLNACFTLYSYSTPIATRWFVGGRNIFWVSSEKFSVTTSKQQTYLRTALTQSLTSATDAVLFSETQERHSTSALVMHDRQLERTSSLNKQLTAARKA